MAKRKPGGQEGKPAVSKEDVMTRAPSAYEAVVAIAKEARRLNAAPGVYLDEGERPIPKAVENFIDGKVAYEIENDAARERKGKRRKTR